LKGVSIILLKQLKSFLYNSKRKDYLTNLIILVSKYLII